MRLRFVICMLAVAAMGVGAGAVSAQTHSTGSGQAYPIKTIRILTGPSGSGSDIVARLVAQGISPRLGQQAIVDNRAGIIAVDTAAKAAADGYTLLIYGSVVWMEPLLREKTTWDPVRDLAPITLAARSPNVLLVNPSLPVSSVKDLIALAKARPGELLYGSSGSGTTAQLAAELFKSMAGGLNIVHVPYKGAGPAMIDLIAGQVHMSFVVAASAMPHMKSGKLKALAVTSAEPSALVPGLPAMAASGLPGYESVLIIGAFAPVKISPTLVSRLNQEIVRVLQTPDVKEKLFNTGAEVVGSSPAELLAAGKSDMVRWAKVIKDAGIRSN